MPILDIVQASQSDSKFDHNLDVQIDAAFRKISKSAICFHIWKMEEDRVEIVLRENYGSFYDDCCYIIYAACPFGSYVNQDTISREIKNPATLERFIHFWFGEKVTQERKTSVSQKVMELDTYMENIASEYRESQGNESIRFRSYFKRGITILSGALILSNDPRRLYQIRGRQWLICAEMESIDWNHFSSDNIMVLTTPNDTFMWVGRLSNVGDRREALNIAKRLQKSTRATEVIIVDDGYEQTMKDEEKEIWNSYLPLNNRIVDQGIASDKPYTNSFSMYKCGYKGTKYWIDQISSNIPNPSYVRDSSSVYILNGFSLGVWMWVGKEVPTNEKVEAMRNGRGFIKKKKYPSSTLLIRVVEGHEPIEFTHLFPCWEEREIKKTQLLGKFNTFNLSQRPKMAAEHQLVDDGTGEKYVFQVCEDHLSEVVLSKAAAIFQSENCYFVQYTVAFSGTQDVGIANIIYMWIGMSALEQTVLKCKTLCREMSHKLGEQTMIVRMNESEETPHFLQIFAGRFIIMNADAAESSNEQKLDIFKVQGDSTFTSKALQVSQLDRLSPRECYVIRYNQTVWVWCGQKSTGDAREVAKNIGSIFSDDFTLIMEGKEPAVFWESVSFQIGRTVSSSSSIHEVPQNALVIPIDRTKVHLFMIYSYRGKLITQDILGFSQSDLLPENVYILDAGSIIYVWCGKLSLQIDEEGFCSIAQEFLETSTIPRKTTVAIAMVKQYSEPNTFTGFFDSWDRHYWDNFVPFDKLRHEVNRVSSSTSSSSYKSVENIAANDCGFDEHHKYPLTVLQQEASVLPKEVDPTRREVHLTHDDFVNLFGMPFLEFNVLPKWKKQELKKKFRLF